MKSFLKSTALILTTVFFVYLMNRFNWVDLSDFRRAFNEGKIWIAWACVAQLFLAAGMLVRYHFILKFFDLNVPFVKTTQATFVGNGLGQWAPGSMAFIEVIRLGLMIGTSDNGTKSKLAVVSLYDRLIGFFCILVLGSFAAGYLAIKSGSHDTHSSMLVLMGLSLLGAACIAATPFVAGSEVLNALFRKLTLKGAAHQLIEKINVLRLDLSWNGKSYMGLAAPILFSFGSIFCAIYAIYFCSIALNIQLDFASLTSVYPIVSVLGLLPLGIGGIGGQQLLIASVVALVGVNSQDMAAACLLQAGLILIQYTIFAIPFVPSTLSHLRQHFSLHSTQKKC